MPAPRPIRFKFSTDDAPPEQRHRLWAEEFVQKRMNLVFVDRSTDGIRFSLDTMNLGCITAALVRGTPSDFICDHPRDDGGMFIVVARSGRFRALQQGRAFDLATGSAVVFDNRHRGELHCLEAGETWSVSFTRNLLRLHADDAVRSSERHILAESPSLRLFVGYLETLFGLNEIREPELAGVHLLDLAISAMNEPLPAGLSSRKAVNARADDVLEAIARLAANPALDPALVAGELDISVRYLHRLLQKAGATFSAYLLECRLKRAHRLLRDPRIAGHKIGTIALESGFSDLSHFNRSFRRRYGLTPTELRLTAAQPDKESAFSGLSEGANTEAV